MLSSLFSAKHADSLDRQAFFDWLGDCQRRWLGCNSECFYLRVHTTTTFNLWTLKKWTSSLRSKNRVSSAACVSRHLFRLVQCAGVTLRMLQANLPPRTSTGGCWRVVSLSSACVAIRSASCKWNRKTSTTSRLQPSSSDVTTSTR